MLNESDSLRLHLAGDWWMWGDIAVRGAGFPFELLLQIGNPELAAIADDPGSDGFGDAYQAAIAESDKLLAQTAENGRFRSAMLWQSRGVVNRAVDTYLARYRANGSRNRHQRQREILIAKYLQRYCSKNESIGFFGPVGWGRWADTDSPDVPALATSGYHGDLTARFPQMEIWAVQTLAERFETDPDTRPVLVPVVSPTVKVRAGQVHTPVRGWFDLAHPRADVLMACDGVNTIADITGRLLSAGVPGIDGAEDVERHLAILERAGYIRIGLLIPPTRHADRFLHRRLTELPDPAVRDRHVAALEHVQAAAEQVRLADEDPSMLESAFASLDETFTMATGAQAYRIADRPAMIGRSLLVEDCRSDVRVTLSRAVLADLTGPLHLVLTSARWLVTQIGERYLQLVGQIFDRLIPPGRSAKDGLGLAAVLSDYVPFCTAQMMSVQIAPVISEFQHRWSQILRVPTDLARHQLDVADIAAEVRRQFAAPSPSWFSGRFLSPDLMLAASGAEAVEGGDYSWVIGELHLAANTLNQGPFVVPHPDVTRAQAMADEDANQGNWLIPLYAAEWPGMSSRSYPPPYLASPHLEYVRVSPEPPRDGMTGTVMPASELALTRDDDGTLWLRHDDGRRWNPMTFFGEFLLDGITGMFLPLPLAAHQPRISIGRLVLSREQWQIPVSDITWPGLTDEADRYRAAREWVREMGLPRFSFVRVTSEWKPFYVDFTSPPLINMIASALRSDRRADPRAMVTVTEMCPGPEDLWLPHSPGSPCTSELRMAIMDRSDVTRP